ncbi:hypothetical protein CCHOA_07230 [Corynebacterium choanae]|uniref:Uncharacterized protein n=1 Tax=Corynebacterium choanae TaxID=1862358 RepID=A0A3G6JAA0_9CORY|nr:hypothetical protein CCHOA_07230 [Corynebacterium choanae]
MCRKEAKPIPALQHGMRITVLPRSIHREPERTQPSERPSEVGMALPPPWGEAVWSLFVFRHCTPHILPWCDIRARKQNTLNFLPR